MKEFQQYELPVTIQPDEPFIKSGGGFIAKNDIQSSDYVPGQSGWKLGENGGSISTEYLYGDITLDTLDIASVGWNIDCVFTADTYRKVSWTSGKLRTAKGIEFSISSGDTGNMDAGKVYYIYFDINQSTTSLKIIDSASNSVGAGKILIGVAKRVDSPKLAEFQVFGGKGSSVLITADNIAANTITANEIAANSITSGKINVSSLSAISADMGTLTSGTITGATIQTSSTSNRGVKITSSGAYGGIDIYGSDAFRVKDVSGNTYGSISGANGYFNITSNNRNILIDASSSSVHFDSHLAPLNDAADPYGKSINLGYYNYRFGNLFTLNVTFEDGRYLNKNDKYIGGSLQRVLTLNGFDRIGLAGHDFKEVGFTFKDGSGNNRYIVVLATADPS